MVAEFGATVAAEAGGAAVATEVGGATVASATVAADVRVTVAVAEAGNAATPAACGALGGAGVVGGVYGIYSVCFLSGEYEEFRAESNKLDAALKRLKGEQNELAKKHEKNKKKVRILKNK